MLRVIPHSLWHIESGCDDVGSAWGVSGKDKVQKEDT